jgi:hypothetical protein
MGIIVNYPTKHTNTTGIKQNKFKKNIVVIRYFTAADELTYWLLHDTGKKE